MYNVYFAFENLSYFLQEDEEDRYSAQFPDKGDHQVWGQLSRVNHSTGRATVKWADATTSVLLSDLNWDTQPEVC